MQDHRLNVLIYPMFSVDSMNSDSNYIIIKKITEGILEQTDRYNFILLLDKNRQSDYVRDIDRRVKLIGVPMPRGKQNQVITFDQQMFHDILKKYPADIIWNNVVEQGHNFKRFYSTFDADREMKVFNYHHYVIHRSLDKTIYEISENVLLQQMIGSIPVDINYFHSQHSYKMLTEEAQEVLSSKSIQRIKDSAMIELGGYVSPIQGGKQYDKFTFIYNHRLDDYKNYKQTFDQFDRLHSEGIEFQVIVTGGDSKNVETYNGLPYVTVKNFTRHEDYFKELTKCHANVTNSIHETYCIAVAESMMANQVIVAPRRVTFPQLLGKNYPYLFDTHEQQYQMLKKIVTDDIRSYDHNTDRISLKQGVLNVRSILDTLRDRIKPVLPNLKDDKKRDALLKFADKHRTLTIKQMRRELNRLTLDAQSFANPKVKTLIDELGYEFDVNARAFVKN